MAREMALRNPQNGGKTRGAGEDKGSHSDYRLNTCRRAGDVDHGRCMQEDVGFGSVSRKRQTKGKRRGEESRKGVGEKLPPSELVRSGRVAQSL